MEINDVLYEIFYFLSGRHPRILDMTQVLESLIFSLLLYVCTIREAGS